MRTKCLLTWSWPDRNQICHLIYRHTSALAQITSVSSTWPIYRVIHFWSMPHQRLCLRELHYLNLTLYRRRSTSNSSILSGINTFAVSLANRNSLVCSISTGRQLLSNIEACKLVFWTRSRGVEGVETRDGWSATCRSSNLLASTVSNNVDFRKKNNNARAIQSTNYQPGYSPCLLPMILVAWFDLYYRR